MQLLEEWGGVSLPYTILSIDLGETTGTALYELGSGKLRYANTRHFHQLFPLIYLFQPDLILLERFPSSHSLAYELEIEYRKLAMKSVLISPSEWKPFMKNKKREFEDVETQHEKDAINMLRYYLLITFGRDVV